MFCSSMDGPKDLEVDESSPTLIDGVYVHYFPVPMLRRLCWCPSLLSALKTQASSFDIMHLHSVFQWPTYAAARTAAAAGLPYLVAPRGMLSKVAIDGKSRWAKAAWIRMVEKKTLRDAAGIHVTTELETAEIRALGLDLSDMVCVPNSVSWPARHLPLSAGPFAPHPTALCIVSEPHRLEERARPADRMLEADSAAYHAPHRR